MAYGVAACVAAALVVLGLRLAEPQPQVLRSVALGEPALLMTLRIEDGIRIARSFPGRIEAPRQTMIGFELDGRIDSLSVQEGDRVAAGDQLARLDAEAMALEREAIAARVAGPRDQSDLAAREVDRLAGLVSSGASPSSALDAARSSAIATATALSDAEAQLAAADLRLRRTVLVAPEAGIVDAVLMRADEMVTAGQPVLSIFNAGPGQFRVALPPDLDPLALQDPRLDIGGQELAVSLLSARPYLDPATNSRSALFALADAAGADILPGQTGRLLATVVLPMRGAWVPFDALRPNPEGTWMLIGVSAGMVAERIDVEVLHVTGQDAFVQGAFVDGERVVAGGVHKVVPGQLLRDVQAQGP